MKIIHLIFVFGFVPFARSQPLHQILTTSGDIYQSSNLHLTWTLGEPVSETWQSEQISFTQGFLQTDALSTSILTEGPHPKISIYPNPSTGIIYISFPTRQKHFTYELYSAQGIPLKLIPENGRNQVDLSDLPPGLYLLKLIFREKGHFQTHRILKY